MTKRVGKLYFFLANEEDESGKKDGRVSLNQDLVKQMTEPPSDDS